MPCILILVLCCTTQLKQACTMNEVPVKWQTIPHFSQFYKCFRNYLNYRTQAYLTMFNKLVYGCVVPSSVLARPWSFALSDGRPARGSLIGRRTLTDYLIQIRYCRGGINGFVTRVPETEPVSDRRGFRLRLRRNGPSPYLNSYNTGRFGWTLNMAGNFFLEADDNCVTNERDDR